ncbi:MAG: four helix bundle protein [Bacteroidales bacterium]
MLAKSHRDLDVYKLAFKTALEIYKLSLSFSKEEKYSLTDQVRRSSRSVCANIAEGYRKRRYEKSFISKLSDAEAEAGETQVWLEFALAHNYIHQEVFDSMFDKYEHIIAMLVKMQSNSKKWSINLKK